MKNWSNDIANSMDQILKSASHRETFGLKVASSELCEDCNHLKDACQCGDGHDMSMADDNDARKKRK